MNQDLVNQIFSELGIDNASDLLNSKDTQAENVVNQIREGQRIYLQSQGDFVERFKEMGRQTILQEIYEKTAREFQLSPDLITNKPLEDVLKLGISKIRDNMSASEKKAEEMITSANKKAFDLENVSIPQIKQQYEKQISDIVMNHKIREIVQSCTGDITHSIDVVLPYVTSKLNDKTAYNVSLVDNNLQINDRENNVFRNKTKTEIMTPRDVIRKILEDGNFIKLNQNQTQNQNQTMQQKQVQQQKTFMQQPPQQGQQMQFLPDAIMSAEQNLAKLRNNR